MRRKFVLAWDPFSEVKSRRGRFRSPAGASGVPIAADV
jgi:hypothetical protein